VGKMAELAVGAQVTISGHSGTFEVKAVTGDGADVEYLCVLDTEAILAPADQVTPA